jgi:hypothetical protein
MASAPPGAVGLPSGAVDSVHGLLEAVIQFLLISTDVEL